MAVREPFHADIPALGVPEFDQLLGEHLEPLAGNRRHVAVTCAAAAVFGGDLGVAYLGTQGDVWDAQQDMSLASLGVIVGVSCALLLRAAPAPPDAVR